MPAPLLWVAFGLGTAAWLAYVVRRLLRHLLFFQIEEYNNGRFSALLWHSLHRVLTLAEILPVLALAGAYALLDWLLPPEWQGLLFVAVCVLWAVCYSVLFVFRKPPAARKPLVLTARARRLLVTACMLALALFVLWTWLLAQVQPLPASSLAWVIVWALAISQAAGYVLIAANGVMYPVEASFRRYFVESARKTLHQYPDLKIIAVTGSYGKTSTKEIIAHVLSSRYRVLKTPRSFNTLMGICKVIHEDLKASHDVFVVEMGTYKKGEIDQLCRLTPPHIGILTAVGPQHLERFKTVDRVAEAKYELMQHLPAGGVGIFNGDDALCQNLSMRPAPFQVWRYGLGTERSMDVTATSVTVSERGTEFDVPVRGEPPVHFRTALLGRHNVSNILAAISAALQCGMSLQSVAQAVGTLEPVEHRLQRIRGAGGVVVIDDAYNANPAGVRVALEVLGSLPGATGGKKVLVTPGMVELGDREEQEHRQMGVLAAAVCDYVILVGPKRTQAIAAGLLGQGFSPDRLVVVQDLDEATRQLQSIVCPGDVVLFENDLPDTYATDTLYF